MTSARPDANPSASGLAEARVLVPLNTRFPGRFGRAAIPSVNGTRRPTNITDGELPERTNGTVSKTVEHASVPRVRIPYSPPQQPMRRLRCSRIRRCWIAPAELYSLGVLGGSIMARGSAERPIPASTRSFTAIRATGGC